MSDEPPDAEVVENRLRQLLEDTKDVSDQLPGPLNLDVAVSELENSLETIARLETAEERDE